MLWSEICFLKVEWVNLVFKAKRKDCVTWTSIKDLKFKVKRRNRIRNSTQTKDNQRHQEISFTVTSGRSQIVKLFPYINNIRKTTSILTWATYWWVCDELFFKIQNPMLKKFRSVESRIKPRVHLQFRPKGWNSMLVRILLFHLLERQQRSHVG